MKDLIISAPEDIDTSEAMGKILNDAFHLINNRRKDIYGNPEDSFATIAKFWNAYISSRQKNKIDAEDVAILMALFKIARIVKDVSIEDSYRDAAGYIALAHEMHKKTAENIRENCRDYIKEKIADVAAKNNKSN